MTPVDLPGCGWWEDGRVVVAGLYSPSLLSHSRLTWACGANWLLIASLYTGILHMQKLSPSRETCLMRLSIRAWACLDTPIHNPLLLLAVLQASEDAPQVKVTCRKRVHVIITPLWVYTEFPTHCVISLMEKAENVEKCRDHIFDI